LFLLFFNLFFLKIKQSLSEQEKDNCYIIIVGFTAEWRTGTGANGQNRMAGSEVFHVYSLGRNLFYPGRSLGRKAGDKRL
jgi:hypothetical protein